MLIQDKKGKSKVENDIDDNDFDDGGNFDDSKETTGNISFIHAEFKRESSRAPYMQQIARRP